MRSVVQPSAILGLLFSLVITILSYWTYNTNGNAMQAWLLPILLFITHWALYRYLRHQKVAIKSSQLLFAGLVFSATLAIGMVITHYLYTGIIDPNWAERALTSAQEQWARDGYSAEAIRGQVEWTSTFQEPLSWGFVSGAFIFLMSTFISLVLVAGRGFLQLLKTPAAPVHSHS